MQERVQVKPKLTNFIAVKPLDQLLTLEKYSITFGSIKITKQNQFSKAKLRNSDLTYCNLHFSISIFFVNFGFLMVN